LKGLDIASQSFLAPDPQNTKTFGIRRASVEKGRSSVYMTRCITDYLVQEHQALSVLLNQLQEQLGVLPMARDVQRTLDRVQRISRQISATLHTHLTEEEQILYPVLEGHLQGIGATLERMRLEHNTGEATEKAFFQMFEKSPKSGLNRQEVIQRGRKYIQWLRAHLLQENGRLFPMVERGLDLQTQLQVRKAMQELTQETTARIAEGSLKHAVA
jgi:hemerythrin-like domain-containing protein